MNIGIHLKTRFLVDMNHGFEYIKSINGNYVQIFNDSPETPENINKLLKKYDLKAVVHSPYIINIASGWSPHVYHTYVCLREIEQSIKLGAQGFVLHIGNRGKLPLEQAMNNMYTFLLYICNRIPDKNFKLYLETTSGQGTELCSNLEDLAKFYDKIKQNNKMKQIKICLDTCHLFSAGYDLRTAKKVKEFYEYINKLFGIENIGLVHLNDSMNDFNTHLDHHANIGYGYIGLSGLKSFAMLFGKKHGIPLILETPAENYESEINSILK